MALFSIRRTEGNRLVYVALVFDCSGRKNNCQEIKPAHFMTSKRDIILRGSYFCGLCGPALGKFQIEHVKFNWLHAKALQ